MRTRIYEPLTKEEKKFAEENHKLIYGFLHRYNLDFTEMYDIIAIGYCKSIKLWFSEIDQTKYKFSSIAFRCMLTELDHSSRIANAKKRQAVTIRLDCYIKSTDGCRISDTLSDDSTPFYELVEDRDLISYLDSMLGEKQRDAFKLFAKGLNQSEIALSLGVSHQAIHARLKAIRNLALKYEKTASRLQSESGTNEIHLSR